MGVGQNETTQVLILGSIYQGFILATHFRHSHMDQPHGSSQLLRAPKKEHVPTANKKNAIRVCLRADCLSAQGPAPNVAFALAPRALAREPQEPSASAESLSSPPGAGGEIESDAPFRPF